jgi:hypothetical protein
MKDGLTKFEEKFDKPRTKWSKAEWRMVAHELARVQPTETRGRKTKTDKQKEQSEINLRAAEFWRDEAIEMESVFDGDVGTVQNRKFKLRQNTATKMVIVETINRLVSTPNLSQKDKKQVRKIRMNKDKATDALARAIQVKQKNRREK